MLNFIKKIFKKQECKSLTQEDLFPEDDDIQDECRYCELKDICINKSICNVDNKPAIKGFEEGKETILIIDDNEGVISFLKDDIDFFYENNVLNKEEFNLLLLTKPSAGFALQKLYDKGIDLNITKAVIDITLGGSKMTKQGNIKLTGVDVFEMIFKKNKNIDFLFYTGNNLNPYIKSNEKIIEQFKNITGKDIKDYILFKTSMDMNKRRKYIAKHLFGKSYD